MHSSERVEDLRKALAEAEASTRAAYQDTTRLIRLLTVIGTPSSPEELIDRTLAVLSEVYSADVTCVAEVSGSALRMTNSCGLPEDDPAITARWPIGRSASQALSSGRPIAREAIEPQDLPPSLADIGVRIAAWVPLWDNADADHELLILYRRRDEQFTAADLQVLASVGYRMHSAVRARERGDAIEWLARTMPELARHLDLQDLLNEAVTLLQRLTGADFAWVVTINNDVGDLKAQVGLPEPYLRRWPRPVTEIVGLPAARTGDTYSGPANDVLLGPQPTALIVPVRREGETVALLCLGTPQMRSFGKTAVDVSKILANYLAVAMTNSELYKALAKSEAEHWQRATHDPLTGLPNRVLAASRIEDALRLTRSPAVGLMFCDLDKFKEVNDRLGHEAGDELIQQVAVRLKRCLRPNDLLARFGGDEFVMVLQGIDDLTDITRVGERVQAELTEPFLLRGERVQISASLGGVLGVPGQDSASHMLRDADAAMYAAKVKGPGRVQVFDEAASHRSMDRLDLRSEMSRALENGQFTVEYQPIVEMSTGTIGGFEALLRWDHPHRGPIAPDVFIPIAEETGAIGSIGAWVLERACEQLARWRTTVGEGPLGVAVNMSAMQLAQPGLTKLALDAVDKAGVDPADLWLEITEHKRVSDDMTEPVAQLHAAGVHFALDDFGMSYSNLSYLRSFPVECIKVDRSFVSGVADRDGDRGIVRAILAIADSFDLVVIAEGVETAEQRDALLELGCLWGQGFLLSRPMSPDESLALLMSRRGTSPTGLGASSS